jgi:hypothetical protein
MRISDLKWMIVFILIPCEIFAQNYTSYFTGNPSDTISIPVGGICLMGGSTEDDEAMKWFLNQSSGGDILVLRASGSNGYNKYLFRDLNVKVNSVETIVFNNKSASDDPYIHQKIKQAEAIWFAGGDQWDYISYWRDTPIDSLINDAIKNRNIAIGGTSAGMAIQGEYYFSARNGTITSDDALLNPYNFKLTIDSTSFLQNKNNKTSFHFGRFPSEHNDGAIIVFRRKYLQQRCETLHLSKQILMPS